MNEELDRLSFELFKLFAEYEYELKQYKFFKTNNGSNIEVDWDRFANEKIGRHFMDILNDDHASAQYILSNPPKKQEIEDNSIVWTKVSNTDTSVQALFGHIRRVRNNLFHGAKFGATWSEPSRNKKLIEHSIIILKCLKIKLHD